MEPYLWFREKQVDDSSDKCSFQGLPHKTCDQAVEKYGLYAGSSFQIQVVHVGKVFVSEFLSHPPKSKTIIMA